MAELINGRIKLESGQVITPQEGGWYDARRYMGGQLLAPGEYEPGKLTSQEVIAQTSPENVQYVAGQRERFGLQPTTPSAPAVPSGVSGIPTPETINLPELYKGLYEEKGISKMEEELSAKEEAYNTAMSKINDNPFLSEASRVGRQQKLTTDYNNATANLRGKIALAKADIETQLNLQTKQFDIESQVATNALNRLNALLGMGALDSVSGETIASLTRSTGISSDLIYSAIQANKAKNVNTQIITSTAENGEMFAVVLDKNTGEIIKKTSLGIIGNIQGGGGEPTQLEIRAAATQAAQSGKVYGEMLSFFTQYLDPKEIYKIYTATNFYGKPPEGVDPDTGLPIVSGVIK